MQDDSPIVRITAAEALGRFGSKDDTAAALEVLLHYAEPDQNVFLGIAAWNALDHLDERARPALGVLQAMSTQPKSAPPRTGKYASRLKPKTLADLQAKEN